MAHGAPSQACDYPSVPYKGSGGFLLRPSAQTARNAEAYSGLRTTLLQIGVRILLIGLMQP